MMHLVHMREFTPRQGIRPSTAFGAGESLSLASPLTVYAVSTKGIVHARMKDLGLESVRESLGHGVSSSGFGSYRPLPLQLSTKLVQPLALLRIQLRQRRSHLAYAPGEGGRSLFEERLPALLAVGGELGQQRVH